MSNELIETQSTEVAEVSHRDTGPGALMAEAIASGNPEMVTAIADVYSKLESERLSRQAVADFNAAKTAAAIAMPHIPTKSKTNNSKYAKLEHMLEIVNPVLHANGLSVDFTSEHDGDRTVTVCTIRHSGGHSESASVSMPNAPATKGMNAHQGMGSALTYGRRYALAGILGLTIGDDFDDDGTAAGADARLSMADLEDLENLYDLAKPKIEGDAFSSFLKGRFGSTRLADVTYGTDCRELIAMLKTKAGVK